MLRCRPRPDDNQTELTRLVPYRIHGMARKRRSQILPRWPPAYFVHRPQPQDFLVGPVGVFHWSVRLVVFQDGPHVVLEIGNRDPEGFAKPVDGLVEVGNLHVIVAAVYLDIADLLLDIGYILAH